MTTKAWQALRHPALLLACVALTLPVIAAAAWLPQLPGQLRDEPVSATRWFTESAAPYGWLGTLVRSLGLFDVFHSPLLYATLTALALLLAAMLTDELATLLRFAHLRRLAAPDTVTPRPRLALKPGPDIHHARALVAQDLAAVHARLVAIPSPATGQAPIFIRAAAPEPAQSSDRDHPVSPPSSAPPAPAYLIAVDRPRLATLRPLLPAGLLVALAATWIAFGTGRSVTSPLLAPGDHFRIGNPAILALYHPPEFQPDLSPNSAATGALRLVVASAPATDIPLTGPGAFTVAGARLLVRPEALALWVSVVGESPQLILPGDDIPRSALGIVVAVPADEATLLLPQAAAGLRVLADTPRASAVIVELYRSDRIEPLWRVEVRPGTTHIMQVDAATELYLSAMPALRITVQDTAGRAVIWLGIVVALAGLAGYRRTPTYVIAEIQPWSADKSLVTVESNSSARLRTVMQTLQTSQAPL